VIMVRGCPESVKVRLAVMAATGKD